MEEPSNEEGVLLEQLLIPGQKQIVWLTLGFAVYPLDGEGAEQRCPGIAVPKVQAPRHATRLFIPRECLADIIVEPEQDLDITHARDAVVIDLEGLSVTVGDSRTEHARVISKPSTMNGHFPTDPTPDRHLDFNLVPDSASFATLALLSSWKTSPALQSRIDFGTGTVSALPDAHSSACWSWGFTNEERALVRRTTSVTAYVTDPLGSSAEMRLSRLDGQGLVATIHIRPFAEQGTSLVYMVNLPVNANGDYVLGQKEEVNFGHLQAAVALCGPTDGDVVAISFGKSCSCSAAGRQLVPPLVPLIQGIIQQFKGMYVGENWCSPRRMLVRE